jgi:hypothetical protein
MPDLAGKKSDKKSGPSKVSNVAVAIRWNVWGSTVAEVYSVLAPITQSTPAQRKLIAPAGRPIDDASICRPSSFVIRELDVERI